MCVLVVLVLTLTPRVVRFRCGHVHTLLARERVKVLVLVLPCGVRAEALAACGRCCSNEWQL